MIATRRAAVVALVLASCPAPQPRPIQPTLPPAAPSPPAPTGRVTAPPPRATLPPDPQPWRAERPAAGPAVAFTPPVITKLALANGIPVYVVENHAAPLVVVQVLVDVGAGANPAGKEGLASLTANLLDEGAGKRSAIDIAEAKDGLGTLLAIESGRDFSSVTIDSLAENLGASLDLLADVVIRPRFDQAEIDRVKNQVVNDIKRQKDDGPLTAQNVLYMVTYGAGHPYATPVLGTEAGVSSLSRDDLAAFHAAYWHPKNAAIVVVGDVTPAEAKRALASRFGAWKAGAQAKAAPAIPNPPEGSARRVILVDRPSAQQGDVLAGHAALSRLDADWVSVEVMNRILGGTFASRINMNLREDKGATYGARSTFDPALGPGLFAAGGAMVLDRTGLAVAELVREIDGLTARPPGEQELVRARNAATLGLAARFETNQSIAGAVAEIVAYDLPLDYYSAYVTQVQAVTGERVVEVAKRWLRADRLAIVVVGPVDRLESELARRNLGAIERRGALGEAPEK